MKRHPHLSPIPSATELNRLHDQALLQAQLLRSAAIDTFWRRAGARLRASLSATRGHVAQLTRRLQGHPPPRRMSSRPHHDPSYRGFALGR